MVKGIRQHKYVIVKMIVSEYIYVRGSEKNVYSLETSARHLYGVSVRHL